MNLYRGLYNLPELTSDSVITIGNFDGVHKGHQAILHQVKQLAEASNRSSVVVLFEPQPLEFFNQREAPIRLTRLREKLMLIRQFDIDCVVCLTFNNDLANMSAQAFADQILVQRLRARDILIGADFRFGKGATAGIAELVNYVKPAGCSVQPAATLAHEQRRISSSWVREALQKTDLVTVRALLGRDYALTGRVIHGDKRGRELGFPTANVSLQRRVSPVRGVFASVVIAEQGASMPAVTNIGDRPVFGGGAVLMESHVLNGQPDFYGSMITVELQKHLREEKKFDSIAALKLQITEDVQQAEAFFQQQ